MKLKQLALAIVLAPLAATAAAEVTFTPLLGAHYFDGATNDDFGYGAAAPQNWDMRYGASFGYRFTEAFGLELEAARTETNADQPRGVDIDVTQVVANGYYGFNLAQKFQPYVLAGVGQQKFEVRNGKAEDTIFNAGVGAFYRFTDTLALRSELRAVHNHDNSLTDGLVLLGLEFSGANGPKAAPVVDTVVEPQPEPAPQPVVVVESDDDADGVANSLDKCPGTAAGIRVDATGCALDSDGDTVADSLDQCPNTPAGVSVDTKGCPLDQDADGVADYLDQCPNTPAGALVDDKGCPKILTETISREVKVTFDSGKAAIKPEFKDEISKVADVLRQYPSAHVEVQGYTDSSGNKAANQRLSEQRAAAVRDALVQDFGIDASRVSSVGYGIENPVADNKTAEGRAQNRRVVAVITGERKRVQMQGR